jgi:hypothetical protein
VNHRSVRALVVVLSTIGILSAGSGVASAEPAAQSQSRASASDCVWFWWLDRWICRDQDQQAHDERRDDKDEDRRPEPEGSHSPATNQRPDDGASSPKGSGRHTSS